MRILLITMLLLCPRLAVAQDKGVISWQTYHRPPGIILTGEGQGTGSIQQTLKLVIDKLPDYDHQMPLTTLARSLEDIKQGKKVCHPALFKTAERERFMYFSQNSLMNPTNRVIAHGNKIAHLADGDTVDLVKVLREPRLTFALIKGRSFTQPIDAILAQHLDKSAVVDLSNTNLSMLFQMIEMGRIDVTIAYPYEVQYYLQKTLKTVGNVKIYKIADMPTYGLGSIACPKNEWGKKIIEKVDLALAELKPTPAYKNAIKGLWQDSGSASEFDTLYNNVFLKN